MSKCIREDSLGSKLIYRITTYFRDGKTFYKWQIVNRMTNKVMAFSPGSWQSETEAIANLQAFTGAITYDIDHKAMQTENSALSLNDELKRVRVLLKDECYKKQVNCMPKVIGAFVLGSLTFYTFLYLFSL